MVPGASAGGRSGPRGTAKDRALVLLGVRWRSREELRRRLLQAGFEAEEVEAAIADLQAAGLVDDLRFAREVAMHQGGRRGSGDRAVRSALRQKGVAEEEILRALGDLGDEAERAAALAASRASRMTALDPQAAHRRLYGLLLRRGYGPDVARDASRKALADALGGATADADPDG